MQPAPSASSTSSKPSSSIHRFNMLYEGWWMSSGVPIPRRIAPALLVCTLEYEEMPA